MPIALEPSIDFWAENLLYMVNPAWEDQASEFYRKTRDWANEKDA